MHDGPGRMPSEPVERARSAPLEVVPAEPEK
jgi:hypothetical protein